MNATGTVRAGEPFKPSASAWNSLVAMKRRMSDAPLSAGAPGTWNKGLTVFVKNGATPLDAGSPIGIGDSVITPDDATAAEWRVKQVYDYAAPEDGKPWGVILAPAPAGALIPLCLSGTVPARITMSDATHGYARINASGELVSGFFGDARILWAEPEPVGESHMAGTPWDAWCLLSLNDGKKREEVPAGYIRLYRGNNAGTISAGHWYWIAATAVLDSDGATLGYDYTPDGAAGTNSICVPLADMPDPYAGEVPEGIANEDRTDYVLASTGSMVELDTGGEPYVIPSDTTSHLFMSATLADIITLASDTEPTVTETFQLRNVWYMATAAYGFKVDPPAGLGPSLAQDTNGKIGLVGTPSAPTTGNAMAYCYHGTELGYGWVSIPLSGGGTGGGEYTGVCSVVISEENEISLMGDGDGVVGFYYADMDEGAPARGFVDFGGSLCIDETDGTLQLQGDAKAPKTGTDQLLYLYDRGATEEGDKKRKWVKIGANGGLEISETSGSDGMRLSGTTGTAPAVGSVWGRISSTEYGWFTPIVIVIS